MKRFGEFIVENDELQQDVEKIIKHLMLASRGSRVKLVALVEAGDVPVLENYEVGSKEYKLIMERVYRRLETMLR